MKKTLSLFVCFMAMVQFATAQTAIENIRKHYNEVKQLTTTMADPYKFPAEMDDDHPTVPCYYHLNIEENYPGTGMHHEDVLSTTMRWRHPTERCSRPSGFPLSLRNIILPQVIYFFL